MTAADKVLNRSTPGSITRNMGGITAMIITLVHTGDSAIQTRFTGAFLHRTHGTGTAT